MILRMSTNGSNKNLERRTQKVAEWQLSSQFPSAKTQGANQYVASLKRTIRTSLACVANSAGEEDGPMVWRRMRWQLFWLVAVLCFRMTDRTGTSARTSARMRRELTLGDNWKLCAKMEVPRFQKTWLHTPRVRGVAILRYTQVGWIKTGRSKLIELDTQKKGKGKIPG
ncbi:uncharacterized protein M421DRAFT_110927 [Didymella exigua CBS 183.55]|uniref:Uncharacterized protein n=1 Tax=Didymella exigua CBS 183.55 TaxID=1150837 RepID=A0A6A5S030_9PLEO|nr:uncharacterized protein M421DRAFT_110927 [Didymella exigua CBS 183.55]KAF1934031.1 hypothetical protein M421DRAFT_110927 [Didymella exigua CBS 183.55]